MNLRIPTLLFVVFALATAAFGQAVAGPPDAFQVHYAANLNVGDSVINITNAGTQNTATGQLTKICVNAYAFSPDEQLISCCSCTVTPNGLDTISARNDLISNTLTPAVPNSIVVKLIASTGTCNPASVAVADLAAGMVAWGTTIHAVPTTGAYSVTETKFASKGLSQAELSRLTSFCGFIMANGSGYGICRSCRMGGQGAVKQ